MEIHLGRAGTTGYMGSINLSGIPAHPNPTHSQEVPLVLLWDQTLPIQGSSIWSHDSSLSVHEGPSGPRGTPQAGGDDSLYVLGQPLVLRPLSSPRPRQNHAYLLPAWFCNQRRVP